MVSQKSVKTLLVVLVSLTCASSAMAASFDSFFDIDIECRGRASHTSTTVDDGTGATVPVEMVALSLRSTEPVALPEFPGPPRAFDSLVNLSYQLGDPNDPTNQFQVDSFFDVFTELEFKPKSGATNDTGHWETEMVSLSLSSPVNGGVVYNMRGTGGMTFTRLSGDQFQVDSFFDVFTEISFDGGSSFTPTAGAIHVPMNTETITGTPIPAPAALPAGLSLLGVGSLAARRRRRK